MSRFLAVTSDIAPNSAIGLALVSGAALMRRHGPTCRPGFWTISHFERTNERTAPPLQAVVDDFGELKVIGI